MGAPTDPEHLRWQGEPLPLRPEQVDRIIDGEGRHVPLPAPFAGSWWRPLGLTGGEDRQRPAIMAILNATPDSFSDGGSIDPSTSRGLAAALRRAESALAEGAEILDVGGESTRPGAAVVDEAEERRRGVSLIEGLSRRGLGPVSIDTRKAAVARAALEAGAAMVNDVSAGGDPAMFPLVAEAGCPIVLMHMRGEPGTMQRHPEYDDVVMQVGEYLSQRRALALAAGITSDRILVDPGIGFGKRLEHNLALLRQVHLLRQLGPVLLGVSRKRMLGELLGIDEPLRRDLATAVVSTHAMRVGVAVVRVHDVRGSQQALALIEAMESMGYL